ncbi:winged helix-turn-helix transcriptional regulator [Amycolatopsis sp. MEPSY49]|uniref:winged helix-turn-helix transcriptional regulator n=1 Tax=Amycolatopsis sp. MEPSY49 TaxID=3151600 RepID=UPI003EFA9493
MVRRRRRRQHQAGSATTIATATHSSDLPLRYQTGASRLRWARKVRVRSICSPPEIPPRVEYELTPLGHTLFEPMAAQCAWTREHLPELLAPRGAHENTAR